MHSDEDLLEPVISDSIASEIDSNTMILDSAVITEEAVRLLGVDRYLHAPSTGLVNEAAHLSFLFIKDTISELCQPCLDIILRFMNVLAFAKRNLIRAVCDSGSHRLLVNMAVLR